MKTSNYPGFYKLSLEERLKEVAEFANLTKEECDIIRNGDSLSLDAANNMIENVIGRYALPIGICNNLMINGKDCLVPMVYEEASGIAGICNMAARARKNGGYFASATDPVMIGQIQLVDCGANPEYTRLQILEHKAEIIEIANKKDPVLVSFGGGARDVEVRVLHTILGDMVIVHLLVNVLDAMGANSINSMAEAVAPYLEKLTGATARLRILSNLAVYRLARARVIYKKEDLGGENVVDAMMEAYAFAEADPFRAATHNKGVTNAIIPCCIATGNDFRAVEAGIHSWASRSGRYTSLTRWEKTSEGDLAGSLELPLAVGIVGGATKLHPTAKIMLKIMDVHSAPDLAQKMAVIGLAHNSGSMRALATEGIQRGHMKLHARNLATVAGASGDILEQIVAQMIAEKNINQERANELMKELSK